MDTELARTFLTVVAAGNFSNAAPRLYVTQSTVSARISALEDQLGCRLFVRNKGGTTLTAQGRWFQSHAANLVRTVARVKQEIGVAAGFSASVTIGGRFGLWESLLLAVLPRIRQEARSLAIRSEIGFEDDLMQGLVEGRLDVGVMYTPENRPGLVIRPLHEETLVYVTSNPDTADIPCEGYVYVDWGPEFASQHSASFPAFAGAQLTANVGWLGLQHILAHGGSGYFPFRLVRAELVAGRLHRRSEAPDFTLPAYVAYQADHDPETVGIVVDLIERTTREVLRDSI
ncbi:MAG: LysR family transcriptional regulator [Pseudomonadales bacterium]|nr:LysR family transcriptional regulator [Pseudomonadales bacterium]